MAMNMAVQIQTDRNLTTLIRLFHLHSSLRIEQTKDDRKIVLMSAGNFAIGKTCFFKK